MLFTIATRLSLLAAITATFAACNAGAQSREFRSLPTDELPPFGMLDDQGILVPLPDPATLHGGAEPEPSAPVAGPSLDVAIAGAQAALAACEAMGAPVAAAVVDVAGRPRALLMFKVYRASEPRNPTVYCRGESAEAEPALPGWSMKVERLFPPIWQ